MDRTTLAFGTIGFTFLAGAIAGFLFSAYFLFLFLICAFAPLHIVLLPTAAYLIVNSITMLSASLLFFYGTFLSIPKKNIFRYSKIDTQTFPSNSSDSSNDSPPPSPESEIDHSPFIYNPEVQSAWETLSLNSSKSGDKTNGL